MVALKVKLANIDVANEEAIVNMALISNELAHDHRLYEEDIGNLASVISAIKAVRTSLLKVQVDFAAQAGGAVLDGRDIGTVVCPNADYKFFVTAEVAIRARRRVAQLKSRGSQAVYEKVLADLQKRDERDTSRTSAPLEIAKGAIVIDTSAMSIDEVFLHMLSFIKE
jgi:cytidylate kinase